MAANKSISELDEYIGLIEGDEILIISKQNELGGYVSNQYKLATLAEQISSDVYYQTSIVVSSLVSQTSSELSTLINDTSSWIFSLSANVSDAISVISNTSSFISSFLSSISQNVYNDLSIYKIETKIELCNFVESAVIPLRHIVGMSTLNYYTYIGDDISKLSVDPRYPELSAISSDVIWFDTSDTDKENTSRGITRINNLQYEIYRLGLQLRNLEKIRETGVVAGDVTNSQKSELVKIADTLEIPYDMKQTSSLVSIGIYGPVHTQNNSKLYAKFYPAGFDYNAMKVAEKPTAIRWSIYQHDLDNERTKTLSSQISVYTKSDISSQLYEIDNTIIDSYTENLSIHTFDIKSNLLSDDDGIELSNFVYTSNKNYASVITETVYEKSSDPSHDDFYVTDYKYRRLSPDYTNDLKTAISQNQAYDINYEAIPSCYSYCNEGNLIYNWEYTTDPQIVDTSATIEKWDILSAHGVSCIQSQYVTVEHFQKNLSAGQAYNKKFNKIYCQASWIYTKNTQFANVLIPKQYKKYNDSLYYSNNDEQSFRKSTREQTAYKTPTKKVINKYSWVYSDLEEHAKVSDKKNVYLLVNLERYDTASQVSSIIYQIKLSADIKNISDITPPTYSDQQEIINAAINYLTLAKNNSFGVELSTSFYDEDYGDYIKTESPFYANLYPDEYIEHDYDLSIIGYDYCDVDNFYYCKFNQTNTNLPVNVDVTWNLLQISSDSTTTSKIVKSDYQKFYKYTDSGEIIPDQYITLSVINKNDIVAYVDIQEHNAYKSDFEEKTISLYVESNVDPQLSSVINLSVGGLPIPDRILEPTVKAICPKVGTYTEFLSIKDSLYKGEIVYCTDKKSLATYDGQTFIFSVGSGSGSITEEQIQDLAMEHLTFESKDDSSIYSHQIRIDSSGNISTLKKSKTTQTQKIDTYGIAVSHLLQISKVYLGGSEEYQENNNDHLVSHNFVELTNASDEDINLDDCYIFYRSYYNAGRKEVPIPDKPIDGEWEFLKLNGIIKAHGTYVIRGKECNRNNNVRIHVDKCDIEWRKKTYIDSNGFSDIEGDQFTRTGELISFDQYYAVFHLLIGKNNAAERVNSIISIWESGKKDSQNGYIDLCGFAYDTGVSEINNLSEGLASYKVLIKNKNPENLNSILLVKYYYMETASQGNKKYAERSSASLWTHIDLNFHLRNQGNYTQYYYTDEDKEKFSPHATFENQNFFTNKTRFAKDRPNMINIGFGIQATESEKQIGSELNGNSDASRCFNWISYGFFNEYVKYRRISDINGVNDGIDNSWKKESSITEDTDLTKWNSYYGINQSSSLSSVINQLHVFYDRIQWSSSDGSLVTTHKAILHGLKAGIYEYQICREDDEKYSSEVFTFKVRKDSDVDKFTFIQTSDQQGFVKQEYNAWKNCAEIINSSESFHFTINTGDIAQSGNRVNEYLDYWNGRRSMISSEEMYTVGNNDLCPYNSGKLTDGSDADKSNLINYIYFYNVEIDPRNVYYDDASKEYKVNVIANYDKYSCPLYSLYSFNYGKWHFVSLLSEIKKEYISFFTKKGTDADVKFAEVLNASIEKWFLKDIEIQKGNLTNIDCSNFIVYMHEMPFTIVITKFYNKYNASEKKIIKSDDERSGGCHLNDYNSFGKYRFSRLFRKFKIRLIIGGHKHTFSVSKAIYDAPLLSNYLSAGTNLLTSDQFVDTSEFISLISNDTEMSCVVDKKLSRMPVIEVLQGTKDTYFTSQLSDISRYVVVSAITAPIYVMTQATGYKLKSNKELPCFLSGETYYSQEIPWLLSYFPACGYTDDGNTQNASPDNRQCRPMYVRYDLDSSKKTITVIPKQIDNIYYVSYNQTKNSYSAKYDVHNLYKGDLSCVDMMFGIKRDPIFQPHVNTISESYKDSVDGNGNRVFSSNTYKISCTF